MSDKDYGDDDIDMRWYDTPAVSAPGQSVRDVHFVRPGLPGLECLAGSEHQVGSISAVDGVVICSACGNELGLQDQIMVKVWDDMNCRVHEGGTAHLAFLG